MGIHVLRHLKEELAWAKDKQLWVISNYTTEEQTNKATLSLKNCVCCYVVLSDIF